MGMSSSGRWGDVVGGLRDRAQVYSTVHVSPVWLGGWRRGPVGVTTEARVCEGRGRGGEGAGGEKGGPRGERKEQETAGEGPLPCAALLSAPRPTSLSFQDLCLSLPGDLL